MRLNNRFTRTLIAASLLATTAFAAQAISLGASVDASTQLVTDTALTTSVKAKLAGDSRLEGSDVSVTTENGVVVLTGQASSTEARAAAEQLAHSAIASAKVDNRIEVPSLMAEMKADAKAATSTTGEAITDGWITTKVKSQLLVDTLTKGTAMSVTTKNDVVFLRGTARSSAEKAQAIKLASETEGVTRVDASKLRVSANAEATVN